MSLLARCPECAKNYRVPHDRKEWHCKQCQAVLEIEDADTSDGSPCPACGALFFGAEAFCEECGADLRAPAGKAQPRAKLERKAAAGEMRKATRRLGRLKTVLSINLVLAWLGGALVLVFVLGTPELEMWVRALLIALQAFSIGLAWVCVKYVDRYPFPLVTTLAALQTLNALWAYYDGTQWIVSGVWAFILWMLVVEAAQVTRLAKQFPDLYLSRRMRGEHLTKRKGGRGGSYAARTKEDNRRGLLIGGAVVAVFVAVFIGAQLMGKGDGSSSARAAEPVEVSSPADAIESFRVAWNAGDVAALAALTKESLQVKMERSLKSLGSRNEWGDRFPPLDSAEWDEPAGTNVQVHYSSVAGEFPVRFLFEDGRWVVRTIKTSPLAEWRPE